MQGRTRSLVVAALAGAAVLGCGDTSTDPPPPPPPPENHPPTVAISAPVAGATYDPGTGVTFRATATDPEDGALPASAIVWLSDRDSVLGEGPEITRSDLSVGNHQVRARATDSVGDTASATVTLRVDPQWAVTECEDWGRIQVGPYTLESNVWNKGTATDYRQCVHASGTSVPAAMGWSWHWPVENPSVWAYPELIYGDKPWSGEPPSETLPIPLATHRDVLVSYNLSLQATGTYNLAFSMWLTSSVPPAPANITHEVMVWVDGRGMQPAGNYEGTVEADGVRFDLYVRPNHGDASGGTAQTWMYVALVTRSPMHAGTLNFGRILSELRQRGLVPTSSYLANIELGTEIVTGDGEVVLSSFDVRFP